MSRCQAAPPAKPLFLSPRLLQNHCSCLHAPLTPPQLRQVIPNRGPKIPFTT